MIWIIASFVAAFLWALSNIGDQVISRKYFSNVSSLEIMMTSGFVSFVPFIFFAIFKPEIFDVSVSVILIFIATSFINFIGFIGYFKALKHDEASNAVPILQLQPILIFAGAYYFLGEGVTILQIIAVFLIIISAIGVIYDPNSKKIKWSTFWFMGACTLMISITTLIDRYYLIDNNIHWVTMMSWKSLGYTLVSLLILASIPKTRINAMQRAKSPLKSGLQYLFSIEIASIMANYAFILALSLSPSAGLVQSLMGIIPAFVLVMSIIGHRLLPEFVKAPKTGKHMGSHLILLSMLFIGLYLLLYDV